MDHKLKVNLMKKVFLVIILLFIVSNLFASDYSNAEIETAVSRCISYLGRSVPNGFQILRRGTFVSYVNFTYLLYVDNNNSVFVSSVGLAFKTNHLANQFLSLFFSYFENNWRHYRTTSTGEIYSNGDVYVLVQHPMRKDDGLIGTCVEFSRILQVLLD